MTAVARRLGATDGQVWSLVVGLVVALVLALVGLPPVVHHTRTIIRPAALTAPGSRTDAAPTPARPAPTPAAVAVPPPRPIVGGEAQPSASVPSVGEATSPPAPAPFGTLISTAASNGGTGVALDRDGLAYVASSPQIAVYGRDGERLRVVPADVVRSLAMAGDALLGVTRDDSIVRVDVHTGRSTPLSGIPDVSPCLLTPGAAACEQGVQDHRPLAVGVAAAPGAAAFVADRDQHIVWRVERGKDPVAWSAPAQLAAGGGPTAIAFTGDAVLVTLANDLSPQSAGAAALYRIPVNANGSAGTPALLATLDRGGLPTGIAVAPDGRIFVAESLAHAVVVLAPDGTPITRITDGPSAAASTIAAGGHDLVVTTADQVVRIAI